MSMRETLKALDNSDLIRVCQNEAQHFDEMVKLAQDGQDNIRQDECLGWAELYGKLCVELSGGNQRIDHFSEDVIFELYSAVEDAGLLDEETIPF